MKLRVSGFELQASLRTRFALGLGAMLLPLALLGASALFLLQYTTAALDEVVQEVIEEMDPVIHLQTLTLTAAMPPNDYLIQANPEEKEVFARLSRELERVFEETLTGPFALAQERNLVRTAREEWRQARVIALSLLALPDPVGNPAAAREMKRMDAHFNRAADLLGQVHDIVHRETGEALARAHAARRWTSALIAGIFVAGMAGAAATAFALARSVLLPLRALETGAKRFGAGDLSHRVEMNRPDELGRLAQTFNTMAAELDQTHQALRETSIRDSLTGLYNRREFDRRLREELKRCSRYRHPLSLLMLDLDHFKAINDGYGHPVGDKVLREVADIVKNEGRDSDEVVARYGGEEFAVIMPETDKPGAGMLAQRIRAAIAAYSFSADENHPLNVTVSIGLAGFPNDADSGETLIAAADRALYAAKRAGRNRVCSFDPEQHGENNQ